MTRTFYQAVFSMFVSGTIGAVNYLFNIYISRNFIPNDFGIFSSIMGVILLLQIPSTAIQTGVMLAIGKNKSGNNSAFMYKMYIKAIFFGLLIATLFIALSPIISNIINIPQHLFVPLSVVLFLMILSPIGKGYLLGSDRIYQSNIVNFVETVLKFLIGFLAISTFKSSLELVTLASGIPLLVTILLSFRYLRMKPVKQTSPMLIASDVIYLFILLTLINIPITVDLMLVNPIIRPEYAALTLVGKIVLYSTVLLSSFTMSKLSTTQDMKRKFNIFMITTLVSLLIGLTITTILAIYPEKILEIMFSGSYLEMSSYLWIYGLGMVIYSTALLLLNYIISMSRNKVVITILLFIPMLYNTALLATRPDQIVDVVKIQVSTFILLLFTLSLVAVYMNKVEK